MVLALANGDCGTVAEGRIKLLEVAWPPTRSSANWLAKDRV